MQTYARDEDRVKWIIGFQVSPIFCNQVASVGRYH